jgi:hypothetical protein
VVLLPEMFPGKALVTTVTFVRLLRVRVHVNIECRLLRETLAAMFARVRFLLGVNSDVVGQNRFFHEPFAAHLAHKILLPRMSLLVPVQPLLAAQSHSTHITHKPLRRSHVPLQVFLDLAGLGAVRAVLKLDVVPQRLDLFEGLLAAVASEATAFVLGSFVVFHSRPAHVAHAADVASVGVVSGVVRHDVRLDPDLGPGGEAAPRAFVLPLVLVDVADMFGEAAARLEGFRTKTANEPTLGVNGSVGHEFV